MDQAGKVTGLKKGMVTVTAVYNNQVSTAQVVIVEDGSQVAEVVLTAEKYALELNESVQLTAKALNVDGEELTGKTFSFTTTNAKASINESRSVNS